MGRLLSSSIGWLVLALAAQAASFDCDKASTQVEKTICSDPELSKLDEELSAAYTTSTSDTARADQSRREQRRWLAQRNACPDRACIKAAYQVRLQALRSAQSPPEGVRVPQGPLCGEFLQHLNERAGLTPYALVETMDERTGEGSIPNVDIDGDKVNDKLVLFRTGSASLIPPDNSSLTLTLSSTGEQFSIEAQRFYVVRYGVGFYFVGSNLRDEKGPIYTDVYQLGRKGITKACSYRCALSGARPCVASM